jgi:hypothetical protein
MAPSAATGERRRGRSPILHRIGIALVQFAAALQDIPEAREDRLVGAAGRLADPFPVAVARPTGEASNQPRGEYAARQVTFGRVARDASREIAADRSNRGAGDVRIGAGQDDLTHDHRQPPSVGWDSGATHDDEFCSEHVIARKYSSPALVVNELMTLGQRIDTLQPGRRNMRCTSVLTERHSFRGESLAQPRLHSKAARYRLSGLPKLI